MYYSSWENELILKMWRKSLKREIEVKARWQGDSQRRLTLNYLWTKYKGSRYYSSWENLSLRRRGRGGGGGGR